MPFLESLESDDVLAIRGLDRLARRSDDGLLSAVLDDPTLSTGITDAQTTLVAAAGAMQDAEEIRRLLIPSYAYIKTDVQRNGIVARPENHHRSLRNPRAALDLWHRQGRHRVYRAELCNCRCQSDHVILVMNEQAVPRRRRRRQLRLCNKWAPSYSNRKVEGFTPIGTVFSSTSPA